MRDQRLCCGDRVTGRQGRRLLRGYRTEPWPEAEPVVFVFLLHRMLRREDEGSGFFSFQLTVDGGRWRTGHVRVSRG